MKICFPELWICRVISWPSHQERSAGSWNKVSPSQKNFMWRDQCVIHRFPNEGCIMFGLREIWLTCEPVWCDSIYVDIFMNIWQTDLITFHGKTYREREWQNSTATKKNNRKRRAKSNSTCVVKCISTVSCHPCNFHYCWSRPANVVM